MGDDMSENEETTRKKTEMGDGRLFAFAEENPIGRLYGEELESATGDFAFGHQRGRGDVIKLSGRWYQVGQQIRINQPVEVYFEGVMQ